MYSKIPFWYLMSDVFLVFLNFYLNATMNLGTDVLTSPNSWNLNMQSNQQYYSTIITGGKCGKFKVGFTFILVQSQWYSIIRYY